MKPTTANAKDFPLLMAGGNKFGRYEKISDEQTWNMITSDGWLVPYAGHKSIVNLDNNGVGRKALVSTVFNRTIAVVDDAVYVINVGLSKDLVGNLQTSNGDVFMAENNNGEIAICDKKNIYIFNYSNNTFQIATLDFTPGYVSFQDGRFISVDTKSATWRLSDLNNGLSWPNDVGNVGGFQSKPNFPIAAVPIPGHGSNLLLLGNTVGEFWFNTGVQLFPYQKNTYSNIDYGCLNASTIAWNENIVVWLASNERSSPTIMFTDGNQIQKISNDGIDFRLASLKEPENSSAFFVQQDGHNIYQITWPADNLSLSYDFTSKEFYFVSDEYTNYHIAKSMVRFNNSYYFVSFNDGNFYEFSTNYTTYDDAEIPRIRICSHLASPDQSAFIVNNLSFPMEQGANQDIGRIDLSVSIDGGVSFGNIFGLQMNPVGKIKSRVVFRDLGWANDFIPQFRFWGLGRFVIGNGITSIYQ